MSRKSFYKQSSKIETNTISTTYEVEKPVHFTKSGESQPVYLNQKTMWGWWFLATGLVVFIFTIVMVMLMTWWYVRGFETAAGTKLIPIIQNIWTHRKDSLFDDKDYKTVLLLGTDQSSNQRENSLLTDTMILASVHRDGRITLVSLPRDLWIDSLKTKVNALYFYGQQAEPGNGVTLVNSVVTEMTGLKVDYYLVINMDTVQAMVDAVGGVEVPVQREFVDKLYPREIDLSSTDPAVLYETVSFKAGRQHMNGAEALKFIRSRHSEDEFEGTDEGREQRQQVLLSALKHTLMDPQIVSNPEVLGSLYRVRQTAVTTNMTDLDIFLLVKQFKNQPVEVQPITIPIQEGSASGLIYHPKKNQTDQWVYLPVDETWTEFNQWFDTQLNNK